MTVLPPFRDRPDAVEEKRIAQRERSRLETEEARLRLASLGAPVDEAASAARKFVDEHAERNELTRQNAAKDAEFNRMQAEIRARQKRAEEAERVEWQVF